ncbi:MAG: Do family serine endopeptidase [Candidatus Adiutrix sp.]|jgi:serine protease Do|nr:Do family serine endopeptidase [Candidatus Adiutrix sp.]
MKIGRLFSSVLLMTLLAAAPLAAAPEPSASDGAPLAAVPSFAPVAEKAEAAVVFISTSKTVRSRSFRMGPGGPGGPGDDFFDRFFGRPGPQSDRKERGQGSGFIIDAEGHIVTNNHVVEGAEEIKVKLSSGKEIPAEIIGRDPKTDLALIKLKEKGSYSFLALGDSSKLRIGDWVVAIGNPFGLEHTVTAGILSARSRSIGQGPYDDYLQTDAAINFGNSGGPLLNLYGEVVGINSAIVAAGGGNVGIGFAIPANMAKGVVEQLKSRGKVVRGWMGVQITKVTEDLARSFGLAEARGALVTLVDPEGPAVAAKARHDDIVLSFDGQEIQDWQDLPLIVANTPVGKKVKVVVWRDGREVALDLTVAELKDDGAELGPATARADEQQLGLSLREITPEMAARQNLSERDGLYVSGIEADSPAAESGLQAGDVILEIDSRPVKTLADYRRAVSSKKKGDILRFLVKRGGGNLYYTIKLDE